MYRLSASLLALVLLVTSGALAQQTGTIGGTVVDEEQKPVRGATILLPGTAPLRGAISGPDGRFVLRNVPEGTYTARVTCIGYKTFTCRITVTGDDTVAIIARLQHEPLRLDPVIVRGAHDAVRPERMGRSMSITGDHFAQSSREKVVRVGGNVAAGSRIFDTRRIRYPQVISASGGYGTISSRGGIFHDPFLARYGGITTHDETLEPAKRTLPPSAAAQMEKQTAVAQERPRQPVVENQFIETDDERFSTFGIDVDAASYTLARRYIRGGDLPPADLVRVEEMVNYFRYDYPLPQGDIPFSITTDVAECPWNRAHRLARIGLRGRPVEPADLPPCNLVFLIDVSGSMGSEDRLPTLKQGLAMLVELLRPEDRVAIVTYAGAAGLALPSTSGAEKGKILEALRNLEAGGSTAGGEGILLAYDVARANFAEDGNNRIILATDGDFNVGISDDEELEKLIVQQREAGIFLTVLGVGFDNYRDHKLEMLADKGNGVYSYVDGIQEAERILVEQFGATLLTRSKDVKIQVEFAPEHVRSYRLIGYENRMLHREDFDDDTKDAGDIGAGHSVTALYEIELVSPEGSAPGHPGIPRRYDSAAPQKRPSLSHGGNAPPTIIPASQKGATIMYLRLRYKAPRAHRSKLLIGPVVDEGNDLASASPDFKFAAAVAQLGLLLRDSHHKGEASYDSVIRLAEEGIRGNYDRSREDFIDIATQCMNIAGKDFDNPKK